MEEKNKNEELKQQETHEALSAARASYSTGTGMGPDDCMSQEFFNSLNDRGAISGTIYVCGLGWVTASGSGCGCGSGCDSIPSCLCGCCSYDLCSCINSGSGSGTGSGSGSGSGSGCGSSDSHTCACSCYYCGAYGCGAGSGCGCGCGSGNGSGCGCGVSKDPIELMDKSKFIPWNNTNCLELCKSVLLKYGITYPGDSSHVFRLTHTVNGELHNWGDNPTQNYRKGIECIDRHLNANRVIIVGVEYDLMKSPNSDGTDHFVVITGRGFDSSKRQYYYTFMDNGATRVADGCSNDNRLYYDSYELKLSGNTKYFSGEYTVTHIRPNDGNYDGVVSF